MIRNEERIIPYFVHHYSDIADKIVIVDHESTDNTVHLATKVAKETGVDLQVLTLKNEGFDEDLKKHVFENVYKRYRDSFDVCIVVDGDEFLHHPDGTRDCIEKIYESDKEFVIKPQGVAMMSLSFPIYSGIKLTDLIKEGFFSDGLSKKACFTSNLNLNAGYGMHESNHSNSLGNEGKIFEGTGIMLLHYKLLDIQHRLDCVSRMRENLSERGKHMLSYGIDAQLNFTDDQLKEEFMKFYSKRELINL